MFVGSLRLGRNRGHYRGSKKASPRQPCSTPSHTTKTPSLALQMGLLPPSPGIMLSLTLPGGIPMPQWAGFLAWLRALSPLVAAAANLNLNLSETAQFSAALRVLARLSLPALVAPQLMASLTAALGIQAVLSAPCALGCDAARVMQALGATASV
jgi:hypothetical protein